MCYLLASILQLTWGFPQTLIGAFLKLSMPGDSWRYRSALVKEWPLKSGLSMGPFIFVPEHSSRKLVVHEYGHTIQSLILGPLYLPLMAIPSMVWAGLPSLERRRRRNDKSYYSFYTERSANWLAERVTGEEAPGKAALGGKR